ncbi:GNAT family N-acetyltransferase [Yeosuana marina]|uniref:GNAT family N-acetyltransferase n=1 Tax=Yeosuana marina TaxID=1565536 RepID=UPI00141F8147|nr:GNAT family N-acetyltransferase [Yeosuana marina]
MITLVRTNSEHLDFINLVKDLDAYLKVTDGDEHEFYNQYNHINVIKHTVVAYVDDMPAGCGAFKAFENNCVEIKRMFTHADFREQGVASVILKELEVWAKELHYNSCILETGIRQTEAVEFYKKNNYVLIPNYGQYKNVTNSLCFKKLI